MNAVIHILYKDKDISKDNLFKNKNLCDYTYKHFLLTDEINLNKTLYTGFEQIFYIKKENELTIGLLSILKFLKQLGYTEVNIINCNYKIDLNSFKNIDNLISEFSIINNIFNV